MSQMPKLRDLFPEGELPDGRELLAQGRGVAAGCRVGASAFLQHQGVACEADYKRQAMAQGRIMRHAQIGFRSLDKTCEAAARVWEESEKDGPGIKWGVDRAGICLDWSMGLPRAERATGQKGTGLILEREEDFAKLTAAAPLAPHFGDFVLGFPAALENTQGALLAGSTAIGNLSQYFAFRLPGEAGDIRSTAETVKALGLIAAQPVEVLVHSNLDDGFGAIFTDLTTVLGMALLEIELIGGLSGCKISHCFGHHFSEPLTRLAFQRALARINPNPGTMIYGNTLIYRGAAAENHAALGHYLSIDILSQVLQPSGHAVNPVPVMENQRIPDIDEIIAAQAFAARAIELAGDYRALIDLAALDKVADRLIAGAETFAGKAKAGLTALGVDLGDLFQVMLALRRLGGRRLEFHFGAGAEDETAPGGRAPLVEATSIKQMRKEAEVAVAALSEDIIQALRSSRPRILVASSDVHEFGKVMLERALNLLDAQLIDGGVSSTPGALVEMAQREKADAIAISTYNGVALDFATGLRAALDQQGLSPAVYFGGRLNQIAQGSNTSLPVDVETELGALGIVACKDLSQMAGDLARRLKGKGKRP